MLPGSPSQAFRFGTFLKMALIPGMTWSYWWSTSRQCSWKSLSFWDRLCRSKTVSRKNWTTCFPCTPNKFPSILLIISHCLCNIIIRVFTTCGRKHSMILMQIFFTADVLLCFKTEGRKCILEKDHWRPMKNSCGIVGKHSLIVRFHYGWEAFSALKQAAPEPKKCIVRVLLTGFFTNLDSLLLCLGPRCM